MSIEEIKILLKQQTDELKQTLTDTFKAEFMNEINPIKEKLRKLDSKQDFTQDRLLKLERRSRQNNLVIHGLAAPRHELVAIVLGFFNQTLELDFTEDNFKNIIFLGRTNSRPILVEFLNFQKKQLVFKNLLKLKGTNIFVAHDMCLEDRVTSKALIPYMKKIRQEDRRAYIRGLKLVVDGVSYSLKQLEEGALDTNSEYNTDNEVLTEIKSGPATPTPVTREKQLLQEFGSKEIAVNFTSVENTINTALRDSDAQIEEKRNDSELKSRPTTRSNSVSSGSSGRIKQKANRK